MDSERALIGESPTHPGEVFVLDLDGDTAPARLTECQPVARRDPVGAAGGREFTGA